MTLGEAIAGAWRLVEEGDLPAVAATLNGPLSALDPGLPAPEIIDAAALFAYALAGTGHLGPALQWAIWTRQATRHRYALAEPRAVWPTQVTAQVLARTGNTTLATEVYHELVTVLVAVDGPESRRTLCARADLAAILHRAGECLAAHATLADAWGALRAGHGDGDPIAIRMCARLATMYRDCADPGQAERHFALARQHAGNDPGVAARVARIAGRAADRVHAVVCTHTPAPDHIHRPGPR